MHSFSKVLILVVATCSTSVVLGAESPPPDAVRHSQACVKAFDLAEYQRAIAECKAAYEIFPAPLLLFSLGQAHRKLGEHAKALEFYRKYLGKAPTGSQRRAAEEQIALLTPLVEAGERSRNAPPEGAMPPPPATVRVEPTVVKPVVPVEPATSGIGPARGATIALAALAVVGLGVGAGVLGYSSTINPDQTGITLGERNSRADRLDVTQKAGVAMLGVAAGAAVGATVALVFWVKARKADRRGAVSMVFSTQVHF